MAAFGFKENNNDRVVPFSLPSIYIVWLELAESQTDGEFDLEHGLKTFTNHVNIVIVCVSSQMAARNK